MIDSGIEARMISVSRQLPRNSRIISAVSPAAISPPIITLLSAALTKIDWSKIALMVTPLGQQLFDIGQRSLDAVDHRQRGDAAGLADRHQRAGRAVDRDGIGLHLKAVMHMRDVAHEHRLAVDLLDRETR